MWKYSSRIQAGTARSRMRSDEIWDEDRWEAFLRENDRRIDYYMELYHTFLAKNPVPRRGDVEGRKSWKERLRAFLRARGAHPEDRLIYFLLLDGDQEAGEIEDIWLSEMPEELFDEERVEELNDFRKIPVFENAYRLASEVLEWANSLPGHVKDSSLVHFCSCITQIGANVAKGHIVGYEHDSIGGNIAYVKRGLHVANTGLDLLHEMQDASYMDAGVYRKIYEHTYEVRNQVALYVQELRERFNLGID